MALQLAPATTTEFGQTLDPSQTAGPAAPRLPRPGFTEQALVVLTTFVLIHETPNVWFQTRADALDNQSNPVSVLLELGLMGLAIARVIGSIDHLIVTIRAELMAFVFVGVAIATSFWSADPAETMEKAIIFTAVSLYGAYLVLRFSLHQILKLFGIMFAFSAVLNLAFVFGLPIYGVGGFDEFTGVFAQKNALGFFAAIALPALIVAAKTTPRWRIVFLGTAVLELVLLIGSQSKTMLLAGVGPTLLLAAYHLFRSRRTLRGAVILSMAGTTVFTVLFATANIGLLAEWLDKDVTLTGRVPLWESLFPVIQERLVFGHGYRATFAGYHSPVHDILIQNPWNPTHAHNAALQILMEMGLLGLIPFLISYVRGLSRSIQLAAIVPGAVGLWPLSFLTTTLMVSITESGMSANNVGWLMYIVAILSASLHLKHRSELGLSNDLQGAIRANAVNQLVR